MDIVMEGDDVFELVETLAAEQHGTIEWVVENEERPSSSTRVLCWSKQHGVGVGCCAWAPDGARVWRWVICRVDANHAADEGPFQHVTLYTAPDCWAELHAPIGNGTGWVSPTGKRVGTAPAAPLLLDPKPTDDGETDDD